MKYWDKALTLIEGCEKVSDACKNCWLVREDRLELLKRKKPTIFAIWSDFGLLPLEVMNRIITHIKGHPRHTFLICTKRPENILKLWSADGFFNKDVALNNIWWGCTVENNKAVDERMPYFVQIKGNKFLSVEPLLEFINIPCKWLERISLVLAGCESGGKKTRNTKFEWLECLKSQCISVDVPFWVKQFKAEKMIYDYADLSTVTYKQVMRILRGDVVYDD